MGLRVMAEWLIFGNSGPVDGPFSDLLTSKVHARIKLPSDIFQQWKLVTWQTVPCNKKVDH